MQTALNRSECRRGGRIRSPPMSTPDRPPGRLRRLFTTGPLRGVFSTGTLLLLVLIVIMAASWFLTAWLIGDNADLEAKPLDSPISDRQLLVDEADD